jgi:hypothetical protein
MSEPENINTRGPLPTPIRPEELNRADFDSLADFQLAVDNARRVFNRFIRHKVYELLGGYVQGIDLALQATSAYQTQANAADRRYNTNRLAVDEIGQQLESGGHIKVKPAKGQVLQVLHWTGSEQTEQPEVVREITGDEEFTGRFLRWSETDKAAELFSWPLTSNNPTEWVLLRPESATGKNYHIVEANIPLTD